MTERPRPGQTEEQFLSYLAGKNAPKQRDTLSLFCTWTWMDFWWVAAERADVAYQMAFERGMSSLKGELMIAVQSYDEVLQLGRPDATATVMHRDGHKAFVIDPFVEIDTVLYDVPFNARVERAKHTDNLHDFTRALDEAGWWILELPEQLHLVVLSDRTFTGSRRDTRVLLAAQVGNRHNVELIQ